ncbi:hypothetical protein BX600DRAFT_514874 [Xylariales sp. PMI_506]|nr:hypothetical protein BX600DRAFT_514874 [Xylariales sp. PMI_506]
MTVDTFNNVGIVGAGIAGLALAVVLKQQKIHCTVFESRPEGPLPFSGPLTLTPNGLRVAEALGLYERLRSHGSDSRYATNLSIEYKLMGRREVGNADKYGYDALRIYRHSTIEALLQAAHDLGIPIRYSSKFSHVLSETDAGATIEFADGEQATFDLVVGADGLHSKVRKYILPDVKPTYTGRIAVAALASSSAVPLCDYPLPFSVSGKAGHVILCPNSPDDPICPVATGCMFEELDREGWEQLGSDKPRLRSILRQNYDQWNKVVQSAIDAADEDTLLMWPFYFISPLPTWRSEKGRVVIFGDAAHALPPIGALGANLALEDAYSLGLLLGGVNHGKTQWAAGLDWWQKYRRARLDQVTSLTDALAKKRQQQQGSGGPATELNTEDAWVFELDVAKDIGDFFST